MSKDHRLDLDNTETGRISPSRRGFLRGSALAASLGAAVIWTPAHRVEAAEIAGSATPPDFPSGISLFKQAFRNWSGEIVIDDMWTCTPKTEDDVVALSNWGFKYGYRIRPRGQMHNWSPLTLSADQGQTDPILLVDTGSLNTVSIDTSRNPAVITAGTGVMMQDLMSQLEKRNLGFISTPAPGDLSLGGVLAIGAHGAASSTTKRPAQPGDTYGSVTNNVLSITAIVWDQTAGKYAARTFTRTQEECGAFLTHLGRAFITKATIQVGANYRLRCQSLTDIPVDVLFGPPGSSDKTFDKWHEVSGRAEAIWFPFTRDPWLKVWDNVNVKPAESREVAEPYNYSFSDNIPVVVSDFLARILKGEGFLTPYLAEAELDAVKVGLSATHTRDIWGWSKNSLLYIKPSTLRVTANGYAIHTSRDNIQRVVHDFYGKYQALLLAYQERGQYPMNGPVEIRVTGLDTNSGLSVSPAAQPWLSPLRARADKPEWDSAVWLDTLTVPGTPHANDFYKELEDWVYARFAGSDAMARVEWSKGWAYTSAGSWTNQRSLSSVIPDSFRSGLDPKSNWDSAMEIFQKYDPIRLYSSPLLDQLFPEPTQFQAEAAKLTEGAVAKESYGMKDGKLVLLGSTVTGGSMTFDESMLSPRKPGFYNVIIDYIDPGAYTHPALTKGTETARPVDFPGTPETKGTMKSKTTTLYMNQTTRRLTINVKNTTHQLQIDKITISPTPNP